VIALFLHALTCAVSARAECNSTCFTFEMSKERRKVCRVPATLSAFVHAQMSVCDTGELNAGAGFKGSFKDVGLCAAIKYSAL